MNRVAARLPGMIFLGVALYYVVWGGEYSMFDLFRLTRERKTEEVRLDRAHIQTDSLRQVATLLEDDPATIETIARERFGMIGEGEVLYRFVDVGPPAADSASAAPRP